MIEIVKSRHSHLLSTARGHAPCPPSLQLLHLAHEILALINSSLIVNDRLASQSRASLTSIKSGSCATGLGLHLLRQMAVTIAEKLAHLSKGYCLLRERSKIEELSPSEISITATHAEQGAEVGKEHEEAEENEAEEEGKETMVAESETTDKCTRVPSVTSRLPMNWPEGCTRLGEVLAQAIHCLCGLSVANAGSSVVPEVKVNTSNSSITFPSNCFRFKVSLLFS